MSNHSDSDNDNQHRPGQDGPRNPPAYRQNYAAGAAAAYHVPQGPPPLQAQPMDMDRLLRMMELQTQQVIARHAAAAQPQAQPALEAVKLPMYDGTTDIEDFLALFEHLADLYRWPARLRLAKLKTSLLGSATECARPDNIADIQRELRARFGISPEEAKRLLLAMKTNQTDHLRELADRIKKLTQLGYPDLGADHQSGLALDQFKRSISEQLSQFLVSRPPVDIDEAARTCDEFKSAGQPTSSRHRERRAHISAVTTEPQPRTQDDSLGDLQPPCHPAGCPAIAALENKPVQPARTSQPAVRPPPQSVLTKEEVREMLEAFETSMLSYMGHLVNRCASAVKTEVEKTNQSPPPAPKQKGPNNRPPFVPRKPPNPCFNCGQWHWYKDCPHQQPPAAQPRPTGPRQGQQGNGRGPQQ